MKADAQCAKLELSYIAVVITGNSIPAVIILIVTIALGNVQYAGLAESLKAEPIICAPKISVTLRPGNVLGVMMDTLLNGGVLDRDF